MILLRKSVKLSTSTVQIHEDQKTCSGNQDRCSFHSLGSEYYRNKHLYSKSFQFNSTKAFFKRLFLFAYNNSIRDDKNLVEI